MALAASTASFVAVAPTIHHRRTKTLTQTRFSNNNKEWTSDFDDYVGDDSAFNDNNNNNDYYNRQQNDNDDNDDKVEEDDDDDFFTLSNIIQTAATKADRQDDDDNKNVDLSACQVRQFSLGQDLQITSFAASLGFDQVTDWEYYYDSDEDNDERKVVMPSPLDSSKPRRTRTSSGSVVRLFRGEFLGRLGATLRAQGLDSRILVKEFSGSDALKLAQAELTSIGHLQSLLLLKENEQQDSMVPTALARTTLTRQDDGNMCKLLTYLRKAPYTGILGEVNLAELDDDDDGFDRNEWYRAFAVPPPKSGSVWIVYEYAGLSTVAAYGQPASVRIAKLPKQRGLFGNIIASPTPPSFADRAQYICCGIVQQTLEAVATLHEAGMAHGSIGRSSVIISSVGLDKNEATSPYATNLSRIRIKLSDFGFSFRFTDATNDSMFLSRAKSFGLQFRQGESSSATTGYAMAEDLHALGFVVLALLLSTLAEVPTPDYKLPATDEDTLQRLLTDIFDKDMDQFRDYVEAEEIWSNLVRLLDEKGGWDFLASLLFARERAASDGEITTARGLLSSPFLQQR